MDDPPRRRARGNEPDSTPRELKGILYTIWSGPRTAICGRGRCGMPNMKEIREMARQLGIRSIRMEKAELIRTIQRAEGNYDCYGTATEEECDQEECLWREDCFRESVAEEIR